MKKRPFISFKYNTQYKIKGRKVVYLMMQHITGIPRNQMVFSSLVDMVLPDNLVRFVDAFVETLSLQTLGFTIQTLKTEGRPSFNTKIFLEL
ncbi:hypothetical protein [Flavobacterium hiemivividum]|uniref:Uncharacterized protein n=1 Tax=Flavobacterium hiemivividum TaxID=2541734 RepID=A0A4R5CSA7_9FLAO|nr:hypothetical protein [Flavobacterium hiemivividum]TDE00655.1 hypothetical protein E0F98_15835 [Flavobacterium hiemivividum]